MSGCICLVRLPTGSALGDSLSAAIAPRGERLPVHDRGKVLTQAMLMLAGGGEACADIEHLRAQPDLFGAVPSDSTLYRTFRHIDADTLAGLRHGVRRGARQGVAADGGDDRARHRSCWTSTRRCTRSTRRTRTRRRRTTRAGSGFIRSTASPMPPASVSPSCCGRATPGRTRSPITSPCSIRRSPSCPPRSPSATAPVTTRAWCAGRSRCAPTRPGAPTSCGAAGNATSASP